MMSIGALLLAAGQSQRFFRDQDQSLGERTKLLAEVNGRTLIQKSVENVLGSSLRPLILVTGPAAGALKENVMQTVAPARHIIQWVENPDYKEGLSTSLRAGLKAVPSSLEAVVVMLADMPFVDSSFLDHLAMTFMSSPSLLAVGTRSKDYQGPPLLCARALFPQLETVRGDKGVRALFSALGKSIHFCDIPPEKIKDIDHPSDLYSPDVAVK